MAFVASKLPFLEMAEPTFEFEEIDDGDLWYN